MVQEVLIGKSVKQRTETRAIHQPRRLGDSVQKSSLIVASRVIHHIKKFGIKTHWTVPFFVDMILEGRITW